MAFKLAFLMPCALISLVIAGPTAAGDSLTSSDISEPYTIDSPSFPIPTHKRNTYYERRDSEPTIDCDWTSGIAYVESTEKNIGHLKDVKDQSCVASPNSCTRVAFQDDSGIFFCNDNDLPIITDCGNLREPATQLYQKCRFADYYTFGALRGQIKNETEQVSYHLRIAAEGWDNW